MANNTQQPTRTQSPLEKGGWGGALLGGLLGASPDAAQGYGTAKGFQQSEQVHTADIATRYADLRLKTQDIMQRDMEIDVLTASQSGKLDNAEILNKRNANMLENIEGIKRADATKIVLDSQTAQMQLQDQQRQSVAALTDSVLDAQSHARAFEELDRIAQTQDSTAEKMFNIDRKWKGEDTINEWIFNKNTALATQQFMQQERAGAQKYKQVQQRDAVLNEYDLDKGYQNFQYDVILQNMRDQAALERAAIKGKKGVALKRGDIESMAPNAIASTLTSFISGASSLDVDDDEAIEASVEMATEVSRKVDKAWIEFREGKRARPMTQGEAIQQAVGELQGRIGSDGKLHNEGSPKLERQKKDWENSWKNVAVEQSEKFATLPEEAQDAFAEKAWFDPEARKERE